MEEVPFSSTVRSSLGVSRSLLTPLSNGVPLPVLLPYGLRGAISGSRVVSRVLRPHDLGLLSSSS